jgi:hypothetical protein
MVCALYVRQRLTLVVLVRSLSGISVPYECKGSIQGTHTILSLC